LTAERRFAHDAAEQLSAHVRRGTCEMRRHTGDSRFTHRSMGAKRLAPSCRATLTQRCLLPHQDNADPSDYRVGQAVLSPEKEICALCLIPRGVHLRGSDGNIGSRTGPQIAEQVCITASADRKSRCCSNMRMTIVSIFRPRRRPTNRVDPHPQSLWPTVLQR